MVGAGHHIQQAKSSSGEDKKERSLDHRAKGPQVETDSKCMSHGLPAPGQGTGVPSYTEGVLDQDFQKLLVPGVTVTPIS